MVPFSLLYPWYSAIALVSASPPEPLSAGLNCSEFVPERTFVCRIPGQQNTEKELSVDLAEVNLEAGSLGQISDS